MATLFAALPVSDLQQRHEEAAIRTADGFKEQDLRGQTVDDLVAFVVEADVPQRLELHVEHHRVTQREVGMVARSPLEPFGIAMPGAGSRAVRAIQVDLHIPYTGDQRLFTVVPSVRSVIHPDATLADHEVVITILGRGLTGAEVERQLLEQEAKLVECVDRVNADIDVLERRIRDRVTARIGDRLSLVQQGDDLVAAMNIPVMHVGSDRALELPVRRKRAVPTWVVSGSPAQREWTLSEVIYEQVIGTTTGFTKAMERRPTSALRLIPGEETLRDWLMFVLNANYHNDSGGEVFIGGEVENGKGKTDILVRHANANVFIGECKFWKGPSKFDEAIDQLLGYTVWRDTKAALIVFITQKNATAVIQKADERLRAHQQFREARVAADPDQRRDYRFTSPHDDKRNISLALLPVVVPREDSA